jgi:hypothetical protein
MRHCLGVIQKIWIGNRHNNHNNKQLQIMAKAIENLTDAVNKLTVSVDAAVAKIGAPGVPEADVQAAADAVNLQTAKLDSATNPSVA